MSGYDVKDATVYTEQGTAVNPEDLNRLRCKICRNVLRDPVQITQCGHRCCKGCLDYRLSTSADQYYRCPEDNELFERVEVKKDRGCQREIASLHVDCPTRPDPCPWRGPIVDIEAHNAQCPNALITCTLNCGVQLRRETLTQHLTDACTKRDLVCTHCRNRFPSDVIEKHWLECEEIPVACEYCHMTLSSRKSLQRHHDNDCSKVEIKCPLCTHFKGDKKAVTKHVNTHMLEMAQSLKRAEDKIDSLVKVVAENNKERTEMQQKISKLEKKVKEMELTPRVSNQDIPNGNVSNHLGTLVSTAKIGARPTNRSDDSPHNFNEKEEAEIKEEVKSQDMRILKISETLQSVQSSVTQHSLAMDEVRLRQDILDVKVTGGVLIWKIPDLRRRYRDAVDRRTISLYSPPFYTSPHGYRMCIRTYLNGDGIGKGTHVSLFFVLMRSEHDNLLPWPFKQSVRFTLINQKNPGASISEAFIPDVKSASFHKPESEMNVASGFPKFARQSVLKDENYTTGDMIFIKCQVDSAGLKLE